MGSIQRMKGLFIKENKVEEILGSFDGMKRAKAPPFLYEKIKAKLSASQNSLLDKINSFVSRPVIAITIVSVILFLDIMVFESNVEHTSDKSENTNYGISTENNFEEILFLNAPDSEFDSIF
jgi:hypothetical protein